MFYPEDIYYLGSGLILYFSFIKIAGLLAFMGCLIFSITNIYFNYTSEYCANTNYTICSNTVFIKLSIANKLAHK